MVRSSAPVTEVHPDYSAPGAVATLWSRGQARLETAETFWLSTVRPDGRPHVTPMMAVWADGALHFCTGEHERKARNLQSSTACVLTTGDSSMSGGLDVVVEGAAAQVTDPAALRRLADLWAAKYGEHWRFQVWAGAFRGPAGNRALVFEVAPVVAFGFAKGTFAQTRWVFEAADDPAPADDGAAAHGNGGRRSPMQVDRDHVLTVMRRVGLHDRVGEAAQRLPVTIDLDRDVRLLSDLGLGVDVFDRLGSSP